MTIAYVLGRGASDKGGPSDAVNIAILVLLAVAAVHVLLTRKTAEPTKWMGKLQTASSRFAFRLGFLLLWCSRPTS